MLQESMADGGRWVWQLEPRRQHPPQQPPPLQNQARNQGWQEPHRQQGAPPPPLVVCITYTLFSMLPYFEVSK